MRAKIAVGSAHFLYDGGLAQMVERALCMREAAGSMRKIKQKIISIVLRGSVDLLILFVFPRDVPF